MANSDVTKWNTIVMYPSSSLLIGIAVFCLIFLFVVRRSVGMDRYRQLHI